MAADGPHLDDATDRLNLAARHLRAATADARPVEEIRRNEADLRVEEAADSGVTYSATLRIGLPDRDNDVTVVLAVDANGVVSWDSPDVDLMPVGGTRTLVVLAARRLLGDTISDAVPRSVE